MRRVPIFRNHQPELLASSLVNGNQVALYRKLEWDKNSRYAYYIHWGEEKSNSKSQTQLLTPKGNRVSLGGAIQQFFKAIEAAKIVKFTNV